MIDTTRHMSILPAAHWLLLLTTIVTTCASSRDVAANAVPCLRPGDELWEVSSRCLPDLERCTTINNVVFRVAQFNEQGWQSRDDQTLQASFQANPFTRTVIYTHGNWMTAENTRGRGSYVYNRISQRASEPIRFIIYSWPSQRDGRPIRDVYEKADRSNTDTFYFAHFLSRIPPETSLGIWGFSFGGRVVGGGLHMAAGGQLEGRRAPGWPEPRQVRVSLIAPAFDRNWLAAGQDYGLTLNNVDALVNIYNSQDPVLRRFRFLDRVSTPIAAGFTGLSDPRATQPLQADKRIEQFDCGPLVGNSHDEMNYYRYCCACVNAFDNVLGK